MLTIILHCAEKPVIMGNIPLRRNADSEQLTSRVKELQLVQTSLYCLQHTHTHTHAHHPLSHFYASVPTARTWIPSGP